MKLSREPCRSYGLLTVAVALAMAWSGCNPSRPLGSHRDAGGDSAAADQPDADGDGIWDSWEGARDAVDTDSDGTPDFEDTDSDDDGVPDSIEGYPAPANGEPADSDADGTPDFRDEDSDGNGIPDGAEPDEDLDADGHPAFRDRDDDGDFLDDTVEIGGSPTTPADSDADGVPDYRDVDSDGDTIGDLHESIADSDEDGLLDRFDADSDEDGYTDAEEAGDGDPGTPPIDTDGDLAPDFRDADADGDGLADATERESGTNPRSADSDGDGVSDLVEISACPEGDPTCEGDATDPTSSPRSRGDFVFFEPYRMPPLPERDTLDFATDLRVADVYFLMDTTGSMGASITSLGNGIATPTTGLIDRVRAVIPDVHFGVGDFKDYGDTYLYRNVQDITADTAAAQFAAQSLSPWGGGDGPEGDVPALWATATGMGLASHGLSPRSGCPAGRFGYPCFRDGAVPIVVLITDWSFHNDRAGNDPYSGYTNYSTMLSALTAARIRVIGIAQQTGGDLGALADLRDIARDTGAVDGSGAPLASAWAGGEISDTVVNQISTLANQTPLDISIEYIDDASDSVDSFASFVSYVEANTAGDPARGCEPRAAVDSDGDGHMDTFEDVTPGNRVCFDIVVKQNDTVTPSTMPQIFKATLRVLGDGFTELDTRDIFFLVPGIVDGPDGPD